MAGEVIRKKLLTGLQAAADGGRGADRAWRVGFSRAARDMMRLPVDFTSLTITRLSLAELLDLPPERALILMLEGPDEGLGLLILSPDLLTALIEVLTIGKCGTQVPDPRKPTRTDAAMLSPLADLALTQLEDALADDGDLIWTSGFRYASFIEEARSLALLLEDVTYCTLTARLSLAHGARVGEMILVFPAEGRGRKPRLKAHTVPNSVARPAFAAALGVRVESATCQMEAVLARVPLPLVEVMGLAEGKVLPLHAAALDRISIEGLDGRSVADGKLGQHRGMRAIRLTEATSYTGSANPNDLSAVLSGGGTSAEWRQEQPAPDPPLAFDFAEFPATGTD